MTSSLGLVANCPASDGQILVYMECSYPFEGFDEDEVVEYLRSEICTEASD